MTNIANFVNQAPGRSAPFVTLNPQTVIVKRPPLTSVIMAL